MLSSPSWLTFNGRCSSFPGMGVPTIGCKYSIMPLALPRNSNMAPLFMCESHNSRDCRVIERWCRRAAVSSVLFNSILFLNLYSSSDASEQTWRSNSAWGNKVSLTGRSLSAQVVRALLAARGASSILHLNEAQQLIVEAWTIITSFYLYQNFPFTAGGQEGWVNVLYQQVEKLDEGNGTSADAYKNIEDGLLPALGDRYALFFRPQEESEAEEIVSGSPVVGLGAVFVLPPASNFVRERPKVISIVPGTLAERAGLQYGDRLLAINGQRIGGSDGVDAGSLIPGKSGTFVRVEMAKQNGTRYQAVLERVPMQLDPITFLWFSAQHRDELEQTRSGNVAYLRITTFAGTPVAQQVRALLSPQSVPGSGLVLDIRGNSGGSLADASAVTDSILGYLAPRDTTSPAGAVVVLVDGETASAAEALTASLVEARGKGDRRVRVLVMGSGGSRRTFGKGEAQAKFELSDGSALLFTVERFLPAQFSGVVADTVLSAAEPDPVARALDAVQALVSRAAPDGEY